MGVKVETKGRIARRHLPADALRRPRIEDPQRIGAQKTFDRKIRKTLHHRMDVIRRVLHAVRPVLKIEIHPHAPIRGPQNLGPHVGKVLRGRTAKLLLAVATRTLGQQIHHAAARPPKPLDRDPSVDEAQRLDPVEMAPLARPLRNGPYGRLLAGRDPRRGDFDPVDAKLLEQQTRYGELLPRVERHTRGLFAVTKRRVENLHPCGHRRRHRTACVFSYDSICGRMLRR